MRKCPPYTTIITAPGKDEDEMWVSTFPLSLSICLSIYVFLSLSLYLSIYLRISLSLGLSLSGVSYTHTNRHSTSDILLVKINSLLVMASKEPNVRHETVAQFSLGESDRNTENLHYLSRNLPSRS